MPRELGQSCPSIYPMYGCGSSRGKVASIPSLLAKQRLFLFEQKGSEQDFQGAPAGSLVSPQRIPRVPMQGPQGARGIPCTQLGQHSPTMCAA